VPADAPDEIDELIGGSDFTPVSDDIAAVIEKAADAATGFASFQNELKKLVSIWSADKITECLGKH
jgi:hypothetical protein